MKSSSGMLGCLRILTACVVVMAALGYYSHVRAQESNNPRNMTIPLRPMAPLSSVVVPPVFGIEGILADKTAAIQLGKALFWDMQAGSDDIQACASCHFNAGADSRPMNLINPGQPGGDNRFALGPQVAGVIGPNYLPDPGSPDAGFGGYHDGDYPFHKLADPADRANIISDINDVTGSQGVFPTTKDKVVVNSTTDGGAQGNDKGDSDESTGQHSVSDDPDGPTRFPHGRGKTLIVPTTTLGGNSGQVRVAASSSVETNTPVPDPVFSYPDPDRAGARINTRRTTGRNTPSVVDAVFNFRNFWDGRAQNVCNGNNPFGARDKNAHLLIIDNKSPDKLSPAFVAMKNSALCSQALGPILSAVEMSADDRDFHQVGRKLLARVPLSKQVVDRNDSVLGRFSRAPAYGLNTSYTALVQKAFLAEWWNYPRHICVAAGRKQCGHGESRALRKLPGVNPGIQPDGI